MSKVRCGIYTRKSSEEGLEQDFNSLHAQHDACAAYIKSQASEGWTLVLDRYDDGGISGGTLARPGLQRLLADIAAGHIDVVVVYKVDRLTRSLLDFSRLVEALDKAGTSFVSVTQSFNTTTSMGRLTLNMLLSFAQFEREVTAERIRDKIAQSKARGMWMGGTPPIGYAGDGRSLAIVEEHASAVRRIFALYLQLGRVSPVLEQLEAEGLKTPERTTAKKLAYGGCSFSRGQIYRLLSNETYIGRIEHAGKSHPGNHEPIIDPDMFEAVQVQLAANVKGQRRAQRSENESLLAGILFDDRGMPMVASHACKGKVRYRYYISRDLQQAADAKIAAGWRLPAGEIEPLVRVRLSEALADPVTLLAGLQVPLPQAADFPALIQRGEQLSAEAQLRSSKGSTLVRELIGRVQLSATNVSITVSGSQLSEALQLTTDVVPVDVELSTLASLKRRGGGMKLVLPSGKVANSSVDVPLLQLIHRGWTWWQQLVDEPGLTVEEIGRREGISGGYVLRLVRLAFLDPSILCAVLDGNMPYQLRSDALTGPQAIAPRWAHQQRVFGFSALA